MPYEPSYAGWCRHGFLPSTPFVRKRLRADRLFDVLVRQSNGCYSAWVAEPHSIWLVVQYVATWDELVDDEDLVILIKRFPTGAIRLTSDLSDAA